MSQEQHKVVTMKPKGIALAIVSGRGQCPIDMIDAIAFQAWPTNFTYHLVKCFGQQTAEGRIDVIKQARERGVKYVWFIDDDTVPPHEAGRMLLYLLENHGPSVGGKVMVAAGVYCLRGTPPECLVYRERGEGPYWGWKVGEKFKAWGAGTGCMMINLEVFDHLPEPWFKTCTENSLDRWSDDLYFCSLLDQAGFELMIDGSILCHHYDMQSGIVYQLPRDSYPYKNRIADPKEPLLPQAAVQAPKPMYDIQHNPWMTVEETNWLIEQAKKSKTFIEIGAWKGITTRNIAKNSPQTDVYAIDTFQGSVEHLDPNSPTYEPRLKDDKWLMTEFVKNTSELPNVKICIGTSLDMAKKSSAGFYLCGMVGMSMERINTVFIDASHDYENVKADIQAWLPLVKHDGVLCGHDFNWPGVHAAVKELLPGAINVPGTSIWMYRKAA